MTGSKAPVQDRAPLRNLFSGIAGSGGEDPDTRLERLTGRAVRRRARQARKERSLEDQAKKRKAAVERRKTNQMRAADYARDRRNRTKEAA